MRWRRPVARAARMEGVPVKWSHVLAALAMGSVLFACSSSNDNVPPLKYTCGFSAPDPTAVCGQGDTDLPPEPSVPSALCDISTMSPPPGVTNPLVSNKSSPSDESNLDTTRISWLLSHCAARGAVKLIADPANPSNNVFVSGHLVVQSEILWIDAGVTLYGSRDPKSYQRDGNCGLLGVSDSAGCLPLLTVNGSSPGIVGKSADPANQLPDGTTKLPDGIIDGQGGEPLVGQTYSWWQMSGALRSVDGSGPNPSLIEVVNPTTKFLMYRVTLHNSAKFHIKLSSTPGGPCVNPGDGFIVWGVHILTPSRWTNSQGLVMSPFFARNTDGIDPGEGNDATCGVIACSTVSTGDDDIALKGGHHVDQIIIAHNHFGTGHGMSIGSETYTGVSNVKVNDLTIDADTRWSGAPASDTGDFNGIRVKSDESRGGPVTNITFQNVCMRDVVNTILINTAYNPLFAGISFPNFQYLTFKNVHAVTCEGLTPPVVNLGGFNAMYPVSPLTLDNVVVDQLSRVGVAAQYANIILGPGDVNFMPSGPGVTVTNNIAGGSTPLPCQFPKLDAPEPPPGWSW
jgi:polygalacturonase